MDKLAQHGLLKPASNQFEECFTFTQDKLIQSQPFTRNKLSHLHTINQRFKIFTQDMLT